MSCGKLFQLKDGRQLKGLRLVRLLSGRREVWQAELEGQPVFAKFYLSARRAKVHWQRELDGIHAFQQQGILTPELLYSGSEQGCNWPVIITAAIPNARSVNSVWDEADNNDRLQLLQKMVILLASHHRAGICQMDLHLGNFMLSGDNIFSLDGDGVKRLPTGQEQSASLDNLALFIAQLLPEWESQIPELYACYLNEREWHQAPDSDDLLQRVRQARNRRWSGYHNKLFRECSAFICHKTAKRFEVIARDASGLELDRLLADLDASFPGRAQALKNGNTCTVWATRAGSQKLVIKRYNVKGLLHGLKLSIRPGRAMVSWENAHRLLFYGIATPKPIAVVKIKRGPLQPIAYFLAEAVDDVNALSWFQQPAVSMDEKAEMAKKITALFMQLETQQISHGDLKATNILIADGRPLLIDLDAMQQHRDKLSFKKAWKRDLQRFMRNWKKMPEIEQLFPRCKATD